MCFKTVRLITIRNEPKQIISTSGRLELLHDNRSDDALEAVNLPFVGIV